MDDLVREFGKRNVDVRYLFDERELPQPQWQLKPLRVLYELCCDAFFKIDQDDLYFNNHIEQTLKNLEGWDMTAGQLAMYLITRGKHPFYLKTAVNFKNINPIGGAAGTVAFNYRFAEEYIKDMEAAPEGTQDDVVLATTAMPKFRCKLAFTKPTYCYVSHGANVSTACDADILIQQLENM